LRTLETTRFAGTLAILVGSGVPLLSALDAGRQVLARLPLSDAVAKAADGVREGQSLAAALGRTRQFPALLVHMIANGEATGRLDQLLERAARLQQADAENRTAVITTLLEPLLLLAMGGIVLVIVLAVMQPIIEINHLLR
jgi:general secretion pathway protein F